MKPLSSCISPGISSIENLTDINEVDIYIDYLNLEQTEDTFLRLREGDMKFLDQVC
jgi:hypothetical protein